MITEITIPYADLKAVIGLFIICSVGLLSFYIWIKNHFKCKLN